MTKVKFHQTVETGGVTYKAGETYDIEMGPGSIYFWMVRGCEIVEEDEMFMPSENSKPVLRKQKGKKHEVAKKDI